MQHRVYILILLVAASGCRSRPSTLDMSFVVESSQQLSAAAETRMRDLGLSNSAGEARPRTPLDGPPKAFRPMTPEEAVQMALANSPVLRELGGMVLRTPDAAITALDPAIVETDPKFGVNAALSAFDAQLESSLFYSKNDRAFNNLLTGGGSNEFMQDLITWEHDLTKVTGTGGQLALRKRLEYDANTAPQNLFGSAWDLRMDLEAKHPLLQGAGAAFNQIAGPNATPGSINGVRIARVNTNVSLLEFEIGVRNLISNVENAYWDLYFAYRKFESKRAARDRALDAWRKYANRLESGSSGGDLANEAQIREQLFRYELDVQNAFHGHAGSGTTNNNGVTGGAFRAPGGVVLAERRLRMLVGMPINGELMIRPSVEPPTMRVVFDWDSTLPDALTRRAELRVQRQKINKRKMELVANRNFLKPRVDAFARYRMRGFGKDLIGDEGTQYDSALDELLSGDYQEWQFGVELATPVGKRLAHTAVKQSELELAREKMLLDQQERTVVHDLSNALGDMEQAYMGAQVAYNRRIAAAQFVDSLESRFNSGLQVDPNLLLDAQQRLAEADVQFFEYAVRYALAIKNVHLERGTLLEYNNVMLAGQGRAGVGTTRESPNIDDAPPQPNGGMEEVLPSGDKSPMGAMGAPIDPSPGATGLPGIGSGLSQPST